MLSADSSKSLSEASVTSTASKCLRLGFTGKNIEGKKSETGHNYAAESFSFLTHQCLSVKWSKRDSPTHLSSVRPAVRRPQWTLRWWTKSLFQQLRSSASAADRGRFEKRPWQWWNASATLQELPWKTHRGESVDGGHGSVRLRVCWCESPATDRGTIWCPTLWMYTNVWRKLVLRVAPCDENQEKSFSVEERVTKCDSFLRFYVVYDENQACLGFR